MPIQYAARWGCHSNAPVATLEDADDEEAEEEWNGRGDPVCLERAVAVGGEPEEGPHLVSSCEVPDAVEAGEPEAESEKERDDRGAACQTSLG